MYGLLRGRLFFQCLTHKKEWQWHACGVCEALRKMYGYLCQFGNHSDAVLLSLLWDAQAPEHLRIPQAKGRCLLRSFGGKFQHHGADVGTRFAAHMAAYGLAVKIEDKLIDRDGIFTFSLFLLKGFLEKIKKIARKNLQVSGFQPELIEQNITRQKGLESLKSFSPLQSADPTATSYALAAAHTASLSGICSNKEPLRRLGEAYGRLVYLVDAYRDFASDIRFGMYNPFYGLSLTGIQEYLRNAFQTCFDIIGDALNEMTLLRHRPLLSYILNNTLSQNCLAMLSNGDKNHPFPRFKDVVLPIPPSPVDRCVNHPPEKPVSRCLYCQAPICSFCKSEYKDHCSESCYNGVTPLPRDWRKYSHNMALAWLQENSSRPSSYKHKQTSDESEVQHGHINHSSQRSLHKPPVKSKSDTGWCEDDSIWLGLFCCDPSFCECLGCILPGC